MSGQMVVCLALLALLPAAFCDVRALDSAALAALLPCGLTRDAGCFAAAAASILQNEQRTIIAQADAEALKATGRADGEKSPSQLAKAIQHIIAELNGIFKDGIGGFFKMGRESVELEEEEKEESSVAASGTNEARKKKKKGKIHKLIGLIKLLILGAVLAIKFVLLLKAFSAALQFKFFLVALGTLILNAARFYFELKKGHNPQKVIYYEHAQHQHHYEGGEEDWGSSGHDSGGGGYWGRSYDVEPEKAATSAQDLAYAKQKPQRVMVPAEDANSNSWF